ncbi:Cytosolic sulfotransferase 13 [Bienertia sinuspersici]
MHNQYNLSEIHSPRLFATHIPYQSLLDSIKTSECRIIYICRNPFDTFVSLRHFFLQLNKEMMEKLLRSYCMGVSPFGPHKDHLLGLWKESKKNR